MSNLSRPIKGSCALSGLVLPVLALLRAAGLLAGARLGDGFLTFAMTDFG